MLLGIRRGVSNRTTQNQHASAAVQLGKAGGWALVITNMATIISITKSRGNTLLAHKASRSRSRSMKKI